MVEVVEELLVVMAAAELAAEVIENLQVLLQVVIQQVH